MARTIKILTFFTLLSFIFPFNAFPFDFADWDDVLDKHLYDRRRDGNRVKLFDYKGAQNDPLFKKLTDELRVFEPSSLKSREEKLSFWINTYNIFAVKIVVDHYPLKSIKDAGSLLKSVWKMDAGVVGEKKYSLDEIEHEILRKMGDPRIHGAIVCASMSCPDLGEKAYRPEKIDKQLDDQFQIFLRNNAKGLRIDKEKELIYLSSIFKWFEKDFKKKGGVMKYISSHLYEGEREYIEKKKPGIRYLPYNWNLNDKN